MPSDLDRLNEIAETLKQRVAGLEAMHRDMTKENKDDRHRLYGFIQGQEGRIEALATEAAQLRGAVKALQWALAAVCGVVVAAGVVVKMVG